MIRFFLVLSYVGLVVCGVGMAGQPSLLDAAGLQRKPLVRVEVGGTRALLQPPAREIPRLQTASLFSDEDSAGFFAPRSGPDMTRSMRGYGQSGVAGLRNLIASAEAGLADYDAVQLGARIKPPKPPTKLTIGEIRHWIDVTPAQPHAIGRYQFIPPTFDRLVRSLGLRDRELFTPGVQDRMADLLLEEAGLSAFLSGTMRQTTFMNNLAKIWAGLPNETGRSHYHGYAGNKAVFSWDHFRSEMDRLFVRG